jgi:hypothetical protein
MSTTEIKVKTIVMQAKTLMTVFFSPDNMSSIRVMMYTPIMTPKAGNMGSPGSASARAVSLKHDTLLSWQKTHGLSRRRVKRERHYARADLPLSTVVCPYLHQHLPLFD